MPRRARTASTTHWSPARRGPVRVSGARPRSGSWGPAAAAPTIQPAFVEPAAATTWMLVRPGPHETCRPLVVRSGGSVPITEVFRSILGLDTVTIGFGLPGSKIHAPNEWFRMEDLAKARSTYARYLEAATTG